MFNNHLMKACLAAVFAIGLTACSGSSDDSATAPTTPTTPTTPSEPTPVAVTLPADLMYLEADDQPMAVAAQTIAAGMTYTSGGVVFTCAAGGEDCTLAIDSAGMASATGGMVTAALNDGAQTRADNAKASMMDTAQRRIIGKDRALESVTNIDQAATATTGTLHEDNIVITRGAGAMASVSVSDPAGYVPSTASAMSNGSWAGARLMRPVSGAVQHLVVYTDIDAPMRVQFYNFDNDPDTPSLYDTDDGNADTTEATTDANTDYQGAMPALALAGRMTRGTLDGNFISP